MCEDILRIVLFIPSDKASFQLSVIELDWY